IYEIKHLQGRIEEGRRLRALRGCLKEARFQSSLKNGNGFARRIKKNRLAVFLIYEIKHLQGRIEEGRRLRALRGCLKEARFQSS
ncbi:hypothetical protein M3202_22230, partial [Alkalihalobacillus oceani]